MVIAGSSDGTGAEEGGGEDKQCNGTRGHRQIPTAACAYTASVQCQVCRCCFHSHSSGMSDVLFIFMTLYSVLLLIFYQEGLQACKKIIALSVFTRLWSKNGH